MVHIGLLSFTVFILPTVYGSHLPFITTSDASSFRRETSAPKWTFRIGDRVYHEPSAQSGLSRKSSDYYYTVGSESALTDELRQHRVGSVDRFHIFHLPQGTSGLEMTERRGSRRSSFTSLVSLSEGQVVNAFPFPEYKLVENYTHPNTAAIQAKEKAAVQSVTSELTMGFLKDLVSIPTRSFKNEEGSEKAQRFLQNAFNDMGLKACLQSFTRSGMDEIESLIEEDDWENAKTPKLVNVVATIQGTTPSSVVVGAHYDSRPFAGSAPGAEDNGSGVAALLAIAKAFMLSGVKPLKTIHFVAFAGEEVGMLGSSHFAKTLQKSSGFLQHKDGECSSSGASFLQKQGETTHSAIIMDEIGWQSPRCQKSSVNLETYDWAKNVMDHLRHSAAEHNGELLEVVHSNNPFGSDHMSFLNNKIPAVLTINGDDENYPAYHQSTDTIEKVDPDLLRKVTKMNLGALFRLAGAES